ncbi:MAG: hypothetical protein R2764_06255 [Bacteroidales bacterium]
MYYLNDDWGEHYFIETERNGMVELSDEDRVQYTEGGTFLAPSLYKGKLISSLSDYDGIQQKVNKTNLNHKSLINLAKDYHNTVCDSVACIVFEKKVQPMKLRFGALAGFSFSSLDFGNKLISGYTLSPYLGAVLSLRNISVADERFIFQLNLILQHFSNITLTRKNPFYDFVMYNGEKYYINQDRTDTIGDIVRYVKELDVDLKMWAIRLPITMQYSFSTGKFRPFVEIGFANMIVLSQNPDFIYEPFFTEYGKTIPSFSLGFSGGLGCSHNFRADRKLWISASYEYLFNVNNLNEMLRFKMRSFPLTIGFSL